jgi:hypothetical protein
MNMAVFWDVETLEMEAVRSSETSIIMYQTTHCNITAGSHLILKMSGLLHKANHA